MTLTLIALVLVLGCFIAALFLRGSVPPPVSPPAPVPEPPPAAVAPPVVPMPRPAMVRIRWIGERGHVYGETVVDKRARRPQMKHVVGKKREAIFLASHVEPNGIWVYREVK